MFEQKQVPIACKVSPLIHSFIHSFYTVFFKKNCSQLQISFFFFSNLIWISFPPFFSISGHTASVYSIAWSPINEFLLASGSEDCTIRLWDIRKPGFLMCLDSENRHVESQSSSRLSKGAIQTLCFIASAPFIYSKLCDYFENQI